MSRKRAIGEHGPIFTEYRHNAVAAIKKLRSIQTGEAVAALYHPAIGDIDLIWGKAGETAGQSYGLAKLVKWHQEVLGDLQGIIEKLTLVSANENTAQLESLDHKAVVRLNWMKREKRWLLTAFQKDGSPSARRTIDISGDPAKRNQLDGTAPQLHGKPNKTIRNTVKKFNKKITIEIKFEDE